MLQHLFGTIFSYEEQAHDGFQDQFVVPVLKDLLRPEHPAKRARRMNTLKIKGLVLMFI